MDFQRQKFENIHVFKTKKRGHKAINRVLTRSVSLVPNLLPPLFLPPDHDVVRSNNKKEYLLLENKGLVDILLKFNLADKKSKGAASNKRQLSMLYKVEFNSFKKILNAHLDDTLSLPLDKGRYLTLDNRTQYIKGSINNIALEIAITPNDFIEQNDNAPPVEEQGPLGSVDGDFGEFSLKVVVYKFIQAYNAKVQLALEANPVPVGTRSTAVNTNVVLNEGVKPFVNIISNARINESSILDSSGFFAL